MQEPGILFLWSKHADNLQQQLWNVYRYQAKPQSSHFDRSTVIFVMALAGIVRSPQPCIIVSPSLSPAICGTMTLQSLLSDSSQPTD